MERAVDGPMARFRPVEAAADGYVVVDRIDAGFFLRLRQVLDFYGVPWSQEGGAMLVPESLAADLDTSWNYTMKADDEGWLASHLP